MNKIAATAVASLCLGSVASAATLESDLSPDFDNALRCVYFAKKAGLPSTEVEQSALRLGKAEHPALSGDDFTLQYADDYGLTATLTHSQINSFLARMFPEGSGVPLGDQIKAAALELWKVNECDKVRN